MQSYKSFLYFFFFLFLTKANFAKEFQEDKEAWFEAVKKGNVSEAKSFLKEHKEFKLTSSDEKGWTAVHWASYEGHMRLLKFLVKKGASLSWPNFRKETPLHVACANQKSEVVKFLLKKQVGLEEKDWDDRTPLFWAVLSGERKIVELLLEAGASLKFVRDQEGISPLYYAVKNGNREVAACLLRAGASPKEADYEGKNCLELAYEKEDTKMASLLLVFGACLSPTLLKFYQTPQYDGENPVMSMLRNWIGEGRSLDGREKMQVHLVRKWVRESWENLYVAGVMSEVLNDHIETLKKIKEKYKHLPKASTEGVFLNDGYLSDYSYSDTESEGDPL